MKIHEKFQKTVRPERVIQFGEGGFLRGFIDWMLQKLNAVTDFNGSVVVVQPIAQGMCDVLSAQDCMYTHLVRGKEGVECDVIDVISRCVKPYDDFDSYLTLAENPDFRFIFSNTTEAGIVFSPDDCPEKAPHISFPAKLTLLLKRRFELGLGGFVVIPCELIEANGDALKKAILSYAALWGYESAFSAWLERENVFCNTLVDRINTGYPKDEKLELGYEDAMVNTSEFFHLFVIETEHDVESELRFSKAGLNVVITKDKLAQYRTRKVRILNGAHTSLVPFAMSAGFETVRDCIENEKMAAHIRRCVFDEIIPTLDLPKQELTAYAEDVLTRFGNPYIKHYLASISLNSVSKFKVRVLPSILAYKERFGVYPKQLIFSFKKLIEFYKMGTPCDDPEVTARMKTGNIAEILADVSLWDTDLSALKAEVEHADSCI